MNKERILIFFHRYKYYIVLSLFLLNMCIIDENNWMRRYKHRQEISDLKSEIIRYRKMYENDTKHLNKLEQDYKEIEQIAREYYFMKKEDEDVFVFKNKE